MATNRDNAACSAALHQCEQRERARQMFSRAMEITGKMSAKQMAWAIVGLVLFNGAMAALIVFLWGLCR